MKKLLCVAFIFFGLVGVTHAGSETAAQRLTEDLDAPRFEISTESAYLLGIIGNPNSYEIGAQFVTGRVRWGAVHSDGWLRGFNQVYLLAMAEPIFRGPENYYYGFSAGLRYNFVRPGARLIPYISGGVGAGFIDSRSQIFVGTIEFLVDRDEHFYFIEMNTRIQVEHTITEEVYGCDLVKEQIRIASGEKLSPHVARAEPRLHAIQCRINAEDPAANFQPSPGRINFYYAPGGRGVRVDSHVYTGYTVPPYYDSLISKLITVGASRNSAIARMRRALDEYFITGIKTTVPFHNAILRTAEFRNGTYDTGFVARVMAADTFELRAPRMHEQA